MRQRVNPKVTGSSPQWRSGKYFVFNPKLFETLKTYTMLFKVVSEVTWHAADVHCTGTNVLTASFFVFEVHAECRVKAFVIIIGMVC